MARFDRKAKSQPKHGKPSDSGASKTAFRITPGVPGWKGPSYIHKKKTSRPAAEPAAAGPLKLEHALPVELEQLILNVFNTTFPASNDFETLKPTLQEIKDALFRRDFDSAFGKDEFLEAYAIRWSPSRALGYAQLLAWICDERAEDDCIKQLLGDVEEQKPARVVSFGGGAAEIMALAALIRHLRPSSASGKPEQSTPEDISEDLKALSVSDSASSPLLLDLRLLDTADWSSVLSQLHAGLKTAPVLSKYASAAARAANAPFLSPGALKHTFTRTDIFDCSTESLRETIGSEPALLTLLFTLNELYTASIPRTTALLLRVTEAAPKGTVLLVVDSPGSYSETAIGDAKEGEERKKYPMSWLMDFALVPKPKKKKKEDNEEEEEQPKWEKIVDEDSMWYRLEEGLEYPVSLENMRFQVHVFRRI